MARKSEVGAGLVAILPAVLAVYPFGLLLGQQAAAKGLSVLEVLAMSSFVFAGSAQFLAVGLWETPVAALSLALAALLINLRHVLMGASLAAKLGDFGRLRLLAVHLMADEVWAVAERRALARPLTPAFWFAAGLFLFLNWQVSTVAGAIFGSLIDDPGRYGLDFAFVAIFIALALGFRKGWRTAPVVAVAAAVGVLVHATLPGAWYVIAGALAGVAAAACLGGAQAARR